MRNQLAFALNGVVRSFGIRTIEGQFTLSFFMIIALAMACLGTMEFALSNSADTINMAGRQRMLSQKIAKEAAMVVAGVQDSRDLRETINLFETSHNNLTKGNKELGILPPQSEEVRRKLEDVNQLWIKYKSEIQSYVDSQNSNNMEALKTSSEVLLKTMNEAVGMMAGISNQEVSFQKKFTAAMVFAIIIIALASRFLGMYWLMEQIKLLRTYLNALSKNDFSHEINADCSENEVQEMFKAYNTMVKNVRMIVDSTETLSHSIRTNTESLIQSAKNSEHGARKQNQEIEQVAASMNQMSSAANDVAEHAENTADSANKANSEAEDGQKVVSKSYENINLMARQLEEAASVMQQLNKDSQQIDTVLTVITGIAEQTNLLALNAAIEAARAGEQGRGFAVVADEVRTLAQRTQESTEEIKKIIERLQQQTIKAVQVVDNSTASAQQSANDISQAKNALEQIVQSVNAIQDMSMRIASAAQEQSHVSSDINQNLSSISSASTETSDLASDARSKVELIHSEVFNLSNLIAKVKTR